SKDPMHFSWMGPAPGSGGLAPLPPLGAAAAYAPADSYTTGWAGLGVPGRMAITDMTGTGAADLVRLRGHPAGVVAEVLSARSGFGRGSRSRGMVPGLAIEEGLIALGDVDGDSRVDLVSVSPQGRVSISRRTSEFGPLEVRDVSVPADLRSVHVADHAGDRRGGLHGPGGDR